MRMKKFDDTNIAIY